MTARSLKYLTLGLRRDRNLSDVQDSTQALNSLLNNLFSTSEANTSFISEDLDAIRGLQNSNSSVSKLSALSDTTVKLSVIGTDPITGDVVITEEEVTPRVRLKDRLENAYLITSKNPAIQGGKGLNCRFIESTEINTGTRTSTGANIFDVIPGQIQETFWTSGYFNFSTTIDPTFKDQYGGLQWTGWFSPVLRDPNVNIYINSTGLFIFEVDLREDGNWQTLASIHNDVRQVQVGANSTGTTITLAAGEGKYVGEGDYWGLYVEGGPNVIVNTVSGDTITVDTSVTVLSGQTYSVGKILGDTRTRCNVLLPSIAVGDYLKVRISAWWPDNNEPLNDKTIEFDYVGSSLFFYNMYNEKPNPVPGPLEIRTFLNETVTPSQNNIGQPTKNRNFYSNNLASITFSPVSGFSEVLKHGPVNLTVTDYNEVIRFASSIANAVPGDVIVPTTSGTFINSLPGRRFVIKDDISDVVRVSNQPAGVNQIIPVYVLNNKGFIDWMYGTVVGTTVTITEGNASLLRKEYIVMTTSTAPGSWRRITNVNKVANTFTTDVSLGSGTVLILVYADKSLIDSSKDIICEGVIGQEVLTTVSSGNQITLKSVVGVSNGQVIQFTGANPSSPIIPNGATVTGIVSNTITISSALTGEIRQDSTVVFAPPGTAINVEGCIVPLNTAPPFIGTPAGLSTGSLGIRTVASNPTLAVNLNDIRLDLPGASITTVSGVNSFDRKLQLTIRGTSYSILAKDA